MCKVENEGCVTVYIVPIKLWINGWDMYDILYVTMNVLCLTVSMKYKVDMFCVKCDKLSKNLPLFYLHIKASYSSTVMHFTTLIAASSDSTCHNIEIGYIELR